MNTTAENLLRIENLTVEFKSDAVSRTAVNNVSMHLAAGETLAVVGESGSGKSVSSLAVMGLLPEKAAVIRNGKIHLHETDVLKLYEEKDQQKNLRGRHIAIIFQEPMTALNPVMRCGEQVAEMLRLHHKLGHHEARRRTIELFAEVKIPEPGKAFFKYPFEMSGGQRQRVMIAMAISCEPSVLIADEPTTALDVTVQKSIVGLLKSLQQKHHMAIVFITHDLGLVREIADRVLVMRNGEVVEQGTRNEIFSHPKNPYTKGLIACRPAMGEKRSRLLTVSDFENESFAKIPINENSISEPKTDNAQQEVILSVKDLSKIYRKKSGLFSAIAETCAVDNVSFDVRRGETLGLVGESGCGKTTLSRMLLGLIEPTAGEIVFDGQSVANYRKAQWRKLRSRVQIIFQDPYSSLNPKMTVGAAIVEAMRSHSALDDDKQRRHKTLELFERVGLAQDGFHRYPHEFSGGQRQRIVIARALSLQPQFVICDESVSALDVSVQAQVLNLLNDLKRDFALTYIFISHDLSVVYHMSDRIMVMNHGRIEEVGEPHQILFNPKTEYTRTLVASMPGNSG